MNRLVTWLPLTALLVAVVWTLTSAGSHRLDALTTEHVMDVNVVEDVQSGAYVTTLSHVHASLARQDDDNADDEESTDEKASTEEYLAIVGGSVHTVSGPTLRNVRILCKDGVITAIGPHVQIPEEATIIDATGHYVYPGLVAVRSFGLFGSGNAEDSTNVFSLNMLTALAGGITTAVAGSNANKLLKGELENMTVGENLFVSLSYTTSNPNGRRQLRQQLDRLQQHIREVEAYQRNRQRDPDATQPDERWIRGRNQDLYRLLRGESVALANANTSHDLLQLAELADSYGITIVVNGAREGWVIPSKLSRSGMRAIITPRDRSDRDERLLRANGSSIENAAILHRHGIPFAIVPSSAGISFGGLGGRDLLHLRMEAAFAVRGGLPNDAAIRAITLDAAKLLGIDHRVGSIEIGKDADFVITDGDLLHYMSHARWTIVNGKVMYDKQKESLFDHIRPDGEMNPPPPDDHWPRRLGDPF